VANDESLQNSEVAESPIDNGQSLQDTEVAELPVDNSQSEIQQNTQAEVSSDEPVTSHEEDNPHLDKVDGSTTGDNIVLSQHSLASEASAHNMPTESVTSDNEEKAVSHSQEGLSQDSGASQELGNELTEVVNDDNGSLGNEPGKQIEEIGDSEG
jgi:hypothetical protein